MSDKLTLSVIAEKQADPKLNDLEQRSFIICCESVDQVGSSVLGSLMPLAAADVWLGSCLMLYVRPRPFGRPAHRCPHGGGRMHTYSHLCLHQVTTVS